MRILRNVSLAKWHTLASKARARCLIIVEDTQDLKEIAQDDIIIGGGSNVIFLPQVHSRLIHLALTGVRYERSDDETVYVTAMAGENWHQFVALMVEQKLGGVENLALIPGTVGAAPVQNIGAYGVEVGDVIHSVQVYDRWQKTCHSIEKQACGFAYRHSHFKSKWADRYVIVSVTFKLSQSPTLHIDYAGLNNHIPPLTCINEVFEAVVAIREAKLPDPMNYPNAGSFFHNPIVTSEKLKQLVSLYPTLPSYAIDDENVKIPAAWLIEACGLKGYHHAGVGIYEHHALVLVNYYGNGHDIKQFADEIIDKVAKKFAITLTIEPRIIGT